MNNLVSLFNSFCINEREDLLQELQVFHSNYVDPKKVVITSCFFEKLKDKAFAEYPLVRLYMILTQYTQEKTVDMAGTATAALLDGSTIANFAKHKEGIYMLEKKLSENRSKYLRILEENLGCMQGRLELAHLEILIARCVLAKGWPKSYPEGIRPIAVKCTVAPGKYTSEKATSLAIYWAKLLDKEYPHENLSAKLDLADTDSAKKAAADDSQDSVDVSLFRRLSKKTSNASDASVENLPPPPKPFTVNDEVTVAFRTRLVAVVVGWLGGWWRWWLGGLMGGVVQCSVVGRGGGWVVVAVGGSGSSGGGRNWSV